MADIDEESGEIEENEPEPETEELLQELDEVEVEEDIEEDLVVAQVNVEEGDDDDEEEEDCRSFDSGPLVDADAIVDVSDGDLDEDDGGGGEMKKIWVTR